jgi:hypothetical protein
MEKPLIKIGKYLININSITHVRSDDDGTMTIFMVPLNKDGVQPRFTINDTEDAALVSSALRLFLAVDSQASTEAI